MALAASIVLGYDTGVTLRQLFYRLVSVGVLRNLQTTYKQLSARTAAARRERTFPPLIDLNREINRNLSFTGPDEARLWLRRIYRRDRTEFQDVSIYIAVEKAGLVAQLDAWFADLGIPILALGGYASQSYVDAVVADVEEGQRPAVLLYAGDFDPSGEDIDRDFRARTGCFEQVVRVGLSDRQVLDYDLPPAIGKASDSRAATFLAKHGRLVQVELDALAPDDLRALYQTAIDKFWDTAAYQRSLELEVADRERLAALR